MNDAIDTTSTEAQETSGSEAQAPGSAETQEAGAAPSPKEAKVMTTDQAKEIMKSPSVAMVGWVGFLIAVIILASFMAQPVTSYQRQQDVDQKQVEINSAVQKQIDDLRTDSARQFAEVRGMIQKQTDAQAASNAQMLMLLQDLRVDSTALRHDVDWQGKWISNGEILPNRKP